MAYERITPTTTLNVGDRVVITRERQTDGNWTGAYMMTLNPTVWVHHVKKTTAKTVHIGRNVYKRDDFHDMVAYRVETDEDALTVWQQYLTAYAEHLERTAQTARATTLNVLHSRD